MDLKLALLGWAALNGCKTDSWRRSPQPQNPTAVPASRLGDGRPGETLCVDLDGDYYCAPEDCNDLNSVIFPGAADLKYPNDGFDNDCDGMTDEDILVEEFLEEGQSGADRSQRDVDIQIGEDVCVDLDRDGVCVPDDCDDTRRMSDEICDGVDNDCDRAIDEDFLARFSEEDQNCDGVIDPRTQEESCNNNVGVRGERIEWACSNGQMRNCGTCDYGEQTCADGEWGDCNFTPPDEGLEACACHGVDERMIPAGILLIVDKSGSMASTYDNGEQRYNSVVSSIESLLAEYGARADFGLMMFPDFVPCGVADAPQIPIGSDAQRVLDFLHSHGPRGNTPLSQTLIRSRAALEDYQQLQPGHEAIAILMSDGEETCGQNLPADEIQAMLDVGINTYLLDSSGGHLEDVAAAMPSPQQVYDVTNSNELYTALDSILSSFSIFVPYLEEVCNGLDDDCDGNTDEGLLRYFYDGPAETLGVGICRPGGMDCVDGAGWAQAAVLPAEEKCDSMDNDCDGWTDECFRLNVPCKVADSSDVCFSGPRTVCSEDGTSTVCESSGACP